MTMDRTFTNTHQGALCASCGKPIRYGEQMYWTRLAHWDKKTECERYGIRRWHVACAEGRARTEIIPSWEFEG